MKIVNEIIGWGGAILMLSAYTLLSFGILSSSDVGYQLLNIVGAGGIVYKSLTKKDYPPVVLNVFWGLVALLAIIKLVS
jgi:hypothetical protein